MRSLCLLSLLSGALLACTEPPRAHRDGGEDVPECAQDPQAGRCDEASSDNVLFTRARAACDLLLSCCSVAERSRVAELMLTAQGFGLLRLQEPTMLEDATACRRALTLSLMSRYQRHYQALDEGRQRFLVDEARACLAWGQAGAQACAPGLVLLEGDDEPGACTRMFAPNVGQGLRCFDDDDCVAAPDGGRSVCQPRTALLDDGGVRVGVEGTCRPLPALGEDCPLPESECTPGAWCAADKTCRARQPLDAPCVAAPCDEATFCDVTRVPASCSLRRGHLEPCFHAAECAEGLSCSPSLQRCLSPSPLSPLDMEFEFCLGDGGTPVARTLDLVPREGGL